MRTLVGKRNRLGNLDFSCLVDSSCLAKRSNNSPEPPREIIKLLRAKMESDPRRILSLDRNWAQSATTRVPFYTLYEGWLRGCPKFFRISEVLRAHSVQFSACAPPTWLFDEMQCLFYNCQWSVLAHCDDSGVFSYTVVSCVRLNTSVGTVLRLRLPVRFKHSTVGNHNTLVVL